MPVFAIVLLILLVLMLLLLNLRVGIQAEYRQEIFRLKVKVGPVTLQLFPPKEKTPKQLKKEAARRKRQQEKDEKKPAAAPPEPTYDRKDLLKRLLPEVKPLLGRLGDKLYVSKLKAYITFGMGDPYQTAIWYGRVERIAGHLWALLEQYLRMGDVHIHLEPDLNQSGFHGEGELEATMKVGQGLSIGIYVMRRFFSALKKSKATYAAQEIQEKEAVI